MTADPVGFRPFHKSCKSTCELRVQREVVVNFVKGWDAVFMSQSTGSGETCYLLFVGLPYSRLFWRAIKLANWSKNVIGEF